ncbi:NAD(P)-dependent oxidoreductase [Micromonospora profundi]|uniref:NAD(P)-dependent oxidoreductase n=1 Tax=Micromonospora profundi TaxID=1420889 RepID=UPI002FF280B5
MTEYVTLHVLRFHRRLPDIERSNESKEWKQYIEPLAREVTVGVLGMGNLGSAAAKKLLALGYRVQGWSRRGREVEGVSVFTGADGLAEVLSTSQIVVCLLPGTPQTNDILNSARLRSMPRGSYLVNAGRGETVDDEALLECLADGHIAGATLDVFRSEPLNHSHPYWSTPNVLITCHTASAILPEIGGQTMIQNIRAFDAGRIPKDVVDINQGY